VRLYVNFFQPSLKLRVKRREGAHVYRPYDAAQTPVQRLLGTDVRDAVSRTRLLDFFTALDPVVLLRQLGTLQDALWRHAAQRGLPTPGATVSFALDACGSDAALDGQAAALSVLTRSSDKRI